MWILYYFSPLRFRFRFAIRYPIRFCCRRELDSIVTWVLNKYYNLEDKMTSFVFQQAGLPISSITRFPIVARFFARGSAISCTLLGRMTNDRSPVTVMEISPATRTNGSSTKFTCVNISTPRGIHPLSFVKQDDYSIILRIFHAESTHFCTSPNVSLNFTPPILSFS